MGSRHDPTAVAVGGVVKALIRGQGLTLTQVSELTGINQTTLSRRVNGVLPFTFPELSAIARLCEVKVSDIAAAVEETGEAGDGIDPGAPQEFDALRGQDGA